MTRATREVRENELTPTRRCATNNSHRLAGLVLAVATFTTVNAKAGAPLAERIQPLIAKHQGDVAVAVKFLKTGESFAVRENEPMPTASLIKLPILVECYRQAETDKAFLARMVTLKKDDLVPGSGILTQHFTPGAQFSLRDAIRLMICYSDNTATNLVVDQIGIAATAKTMEAMGYPNTKLHSKVYKRESSVFPERSKQFGLGSTTAGEMVRLLEAIERRELVSPAACLAMLEHLKTCDDTDKFPRFLPKGTALAFKTGSVSAARTAAGILYTPAGPIVLCVLTNNNKDQRWDPENAGDRLCAEIAREVYGHFNPPTK